MKIISFIGLKLTSIAFLLITLANVFFPQTIWAYSSTAGAYLVIGQPNYGSSGASVVTKQGLTGPAGMTSDGVHLVIADSANNRILIYNSIPTLSYAIPDVVVGQKDFISNWTNQGGGPAANTLDYPTEMDMAGNKLLVTDASNNRILIYSQLPQQNNVNADVVIGQVDMVSNAGTGSATATQLSQPNSVAYDPISGKMAIADTGNNRILLYNKVPTVNNTAADIVLGQTSFTKNGADIRQDALSIPYGVRFINGKLVVSDSGNERVLIWNTIPTTNGQPADVVIGQPNFTSNSTNQGVNAASNTLSFPMDTTFDGTRFIIDDNGNNRLLVFNTIPSANNPNADQVLGQTNFTNTSINSGGISSNTLNNPSGGLISVGRSLFVCDTSNNRVLTFYNYSSTTSMSLTNSPIGQPNGLLRMNGNITLTNYYTVKSVQYQVNSGGWQSATAIDGTFDETKEDFYIMYDPNSNKKGDGYTLRVNANNSNNDLLDNLFYFEPFKVNGPDPGYITNTYYPSFDFSVNKQNQVMSDNLSSYQIWIKRPKANNWTLYISYIPVDFNLVRLNTENINRGSYPNLTHNGTYETSYDAITYSDDSARISVHNKTGFWMIGTYQWKVVALDKAGHTLETAPRTIINNSRVRLYNPSFFPLEILSISGVTPHTISTLYPWRILPLYKTTVQNPIIYGLAPKNASITLDIIDLFCTQNSLQNCTQEFSTTANSDSRFGVNLPDNLLKQKQNYAFSLSSMLDNNYNELPIFNLRYDIPNIISYLPKASSIGDNPRVQMFLNKKISNTWDVSPTPVNKKNDTHRFCIFQLCF